MATPFGTIKEFSPESDSIKAYLERVQLYFTANAVDEDKQVPILLSSIGASTYALLSDLVAPHPPSTKSLTVISETLQRHFEPKRAVIAERFYFHKRDQAAGESIAEYDAHLRKLAVHCKFGDTLDDTLRDRFVCGLRHDAIQRRLLSEKELTYQKAMEIAQGMETADRNSKAFKGTEIAVKKLHSNPPRSGGSQQACYRCNRPGHSAGTCRFKDSECHACGKKGHIAPACRSKPRTQPRQQQPSHKGKFSKRKPETTHQIQTEAAAEGSSSDEYPIFKLGERSSKPLEVPLIINGKRLTMELDTGAAVSIISEATRKEFFPNEKLHQSKILLKTYTEEPIRLIGNLHVRVQYDDQVAKLALVVVAGNGPSLFGRNWLKYLKLNWSEIASVRSTQSEGLDALLKRHAPLFDEGLGTVEPFRATLHVDPDATPKFFKPRQVPFAIKDAIGRELDRMEKQGTIEKVDHSEWAAPIVAVPKKDGTFRICGDYKVTVNQALAVDQYPLPKPDDLFATLAGGKVFTKLDLSQAYLQLRLDEKSSDYVTINTHQGLYRCNRLPFGVASAPALFQKLMDTVLQGIPGVTCYIDDILISSPDEAGHIKTLDTVLERLEKHGFRLKLVKCQFLMPSVDYLGHLIDASGIRALPGKIEAIQSAPPPQNVAQLRSFLGLLNYYGKFIPNLSTILHPLNDLLKADRKWEWTQDCSKAFTLAKEQLSSDKVLTHYDPKMPLNLATDASAYGIGAVVSHVFPDGSERPIAFASRTLSPSERNYAQIEKEALSLVFGVKKFHQYLYGRHFNLITDHKPLTAILGPKKGVPSLAAARMQRWALLLSAYTYSISYKPTDLHSNADGLSRLPLPTTTEKDSVDSIFNMGQIQSLPVTASDIQKATRSDRTLSKVFQHVRGGWPKEVQKELEPYKSRQDEIVLEGGCLMWGIRVIIPEHLQQKVLQSLHANHPGISRMKAVARSYFWWSGLDEAIERTAKSCPACQAVKSSPPAAPLHPWVWPDAPWKRVHIDFAGPFLGKMFLIAVDAHSKWPEVVMMSSTTSQLTIDVLRSLFSRYGLPEQLVSDNGPQFTSEEFAQFTKMNGIKHILCAPYHPSSNGLAERFVQTFKRAMKASAEEPGSLNQRLNQFLFTYRSCPHATTNVSPSELFLGRTLRTRFDLLKPDLKSKVLDKQASQKSQHDKHSKTRCFTPGQAVMIRDFRPNSNKWMPGTVLSVLGPVTYHVEVEKGKVLKRHVDHMRERMVINEGRAPTQPDPSAIQDNFDYPALSPTPAPGAAITAPGDVPPRRYPDRDRRPPERLMVVV